MKPSEIPSVKKAMNFTTFHGFSRVFHVSRDPLNFAAIGRAPKVSHRQR